MNKIKNCLKDINHWMNEHYLRLNIAMTNIHFLGKKRNLEKCSINIKIGQNIYDSNDNDCLIPGLKIQPEIRGWAENLYS